MLKAGELLKWAAVVVVLYFGYKILSGFTSRFDMGSSNMGGAVVPYAPGGMPGTVPYRVQQWAPWGYDMNNYRERNVNYRPDPYDPAAGGRMAPWWANLGNVSFTAGDVAVNSAF